HVVVAAGRAAETPVLAIAGPVGPLRDIGAGGGGGVVVVQAEQAVGVDHAVLAVAVGGHIPVFGPGAGVGLLLDPGALGGRCGGPGQSLAAQARFEDPGAIADAAAAVEGAEAAGEGGPAAAVSHLQDVQLRVAAIVQVVVVDRDPVAAILFQVGDVAGAFV